MTPEGKIKAKLKRKLKDFPDVYQFWPVQTGYGKQGLDVFLCVRGQWIAVETKAPGKHMTPLQKQTAADIVKAGGIAIEISSDEAIEKCMALIKVLIDERFH